MCVCGSKKLSIILDREKAGSVIHTEPCTRFFSFQIVVKMLTSEKPFLEKNKESPGEGGCVPSEVLTAANHVLRNKGWKPNVPLGFLFLFLCWQCVPWLFNEPSLEELSFGKQEF